MTAADPAEALLDTSAWVATLAGEAAASAVAAATDGLRLVTTPLVLAELGALHALGRLIGSDPIVAIEERARIEPLTRDDAAFAANVYARVRSKRASKLGLADALIYAAAQRIGAAYVTLDAALAAEPGVVVVAGTKRKR